MDTSIDRINKATKDTPIFCAMGKRSIVWFRHYGFPGATDSAYQISKTAARDELGRCGIDLDLLVAGA